MNPQLIIAAVIALGSFGAAWQLQEWRYGAKESERVEQQLESERLAAKGALRNADRVIAAQNKAQAHERGLRMDAAGARATADRLLDAKDAALRTAATSHAACLERTRAFGELLGAMETAGRGMAEKADRHASDAQRLSESWPE